MVFLEELFMKSFILKSLETTTKKHAKLPNNAELNHTQVGIVHFLLTGTLCILYNSSIWFDKMSLGWFIKYIKGSQVRISKLRCTSVPEDCFQANSADPDEMLHYGVYCIQRVKSNSL